uniref:T200A protein n=1 Tax=Syphacia muris TaxID=451379 RepID=A0A0N5ARS3_9BILA
MFSGQKWPSEGIASKIADSRQQLQLSYCKCAMVNVHIISSPSHNGRRPRYNHRSYPPILEHTLWAACRTTVLGSFVIVIGIMMTAFGYFHSELSQEERFDKTRRRKDVPIETKQFLLRSLQFFGPILMAIGAFMLIAACVITLENRDSHARIIYGDDRKRLKRKSESEVSALSPRKLTFEEIRNWKPRKCRISRLRSTEVKLLEKRRVLSVSCLPMLFQSADTKELYENLLNDFKNAYENEEIEGDKKPNSAQKSPIASVNNSLTMPNLFAKEDVVAEIHAGPLADDSDSMLSATSSVSGKVQLPSQKDLCSVMSIAEMELYDADEDSFKDEVSLVIRRDINIDDMALSPYSSFSKYDRPKSICIGNSHLTETRIDLSSQHCRYFSLPNFRNRLNAESSRSLLSSSMRVTLPSTPN